MLYTLVFVVGLGHRRFDCKLKKTALCQLWVCLKMGDIPSTGFLMIFNGEKDDKPWYLMATIPYYKL